MSSAVLRIRALAVKSWLVARRRDSRSSVELGDAGLLGIDLPERYGGSGGEFEHSAVVVEALGLAHDSASGWIVHSPIVVHYINTYGSEEQKQRWMPASSMVRRHWRLR